MKTHRYLIWARFFALSIFSNSIAARAAEIEQFRAQEIQPIRQPEPVQVIKPIMIETNRADSATTQLDSLAGANTITNANSSTGIEAFQAQETTRLKPAGIDAIKKPSPLDSNLPGRWRLQIPGVAYQTEQDKGPTVKRELHVGTGSTFGEIRILPNGSYYWKKNGEIQRGRLEQVKPRNYEDPNLTYWKVQHGGEIFYLSVSAASPDELTLYSTASNLYAASGQRLP
ncbi:MAG: hypothetical protein ACTHMT_10880 [Verrucomicrobiota bacterium]